MKQIKKILSTLFVTASLLSFSQITFGVKANMLYQADKPTWENIKNGTTTVYQDKGKNNVGYNAGIALKINTPLGIFIQPELYYTTFSNEFTDVATNTTIEVKNNRADLPVLVGYNLLGKTLGIYAGPVASYKLSTDNQYNDFKENATKEFTLGYQFGAQVTISKLVVSARYEGAFSNDQREFINTNVSSNEVIRYDNRPSLLMFGLGLNF
ncbi:outer membrane beta-barrel protein [Cloacibacterium sp. TD35]|uniref:outer membrane beta-barrel protein n=1 Tax=Cloacibacterium sp. TD35 TaxID=2976818 RepID=UPI00237E2330|nr:outer membrane beta-barrel protein [Cloacibacterium sp. TD35]WDT68453.1 PorT family protein [Cloacibacterium sp. TD35]